MLKMALLRDNHEVLEARDVATAKSIVQHEEPNLAIVDWMLPDVSGIDFIRWLRRQKDIQNIPVLMLIIARRQPAASDLRLIVSIIKTITDLERIGDQAEKLGAFAIHLNYENVSADKYINLDNICELANKVLRKSLDSFARMDADGVLKAARNQKYVTRIVGSQGAGTHRRSRQEHQ
jgi:CheY-like chemotaxis protein